MLLTESVFDSVLCFYPAPSPKTGGQHQSFFMGILQIFPDFLFCRTRSFCLFSKWIKDYKNLFSLLKKQFNLFTVTCWKSFPAIRVSVKSYWWELIINNVLHFYPATFAIIFLILFTISFPENDIERPSLYFHLMSKWI